MELNQEENNAGSTTDTGRGSVELDDVDTKDVHKRMRASDMPDSSEENTYTISSDSSETTASPRSSHGSEDDKDDGGADCMNVDSIGNSRDNTLSGGNEDDLFDPIYDEDDRL